MVANVYLTNVSAILGTTGSNPTLVIGDDLVVSGNLPHRQSTGGCPCDGACGGGSVGEQNSTN